VGVVCLFCDANALDPNRLVSQYVREQWTTEKRFSGGVIRAITQTANGYLWIGTDNGLIRFDGFNFQVVPLTPSSPSSDGPVLGLGTDADGNLLVRLQGQMLRQNSRGFESMPSGTGPTVSHVTAMGKGEHGGAILSDLLGGTLRFRREKLEIITNRDVAPGSSTVISIAETRDGKIWMGTLGTGLFYLQEGRLTHVAAGFPDNKINCLLPLDDNNLWVGTDSGLFRWNGTELKRAEVPATLRKVQVLSMLRDRNSNSWIGTSRGLIRINAGGVALAEEKELRGDGGINALFEDREGNIWVGGGRGLERVQDSIFLTYSPAASLPSGNNGPIYVDPENRTWFAPARGGLYFLKEGRVQRITTAPLDRDVVYSIGGLNDEIWIGGQHSGLTRLQYRDGLVSTRTYTEANGLAQNSIFAVYQSRDGAVWAGTLTGGVSKYWDGHFTTYTTAGGLASNSISAISETRNGTMWFGTPNGLSSLSNGDWKAFTLQDGLPDRSVLCLFEDSSGVLWIGTSKGLAFFKSGHIQVPQAPEPLRGQILGIAIDQHGWLWIATLNRVMRVQRDHLVAGLLEPPDVREYGPADGLSSIEGVKRNNSVVADSQGRIWFSMSRGLSVVDPSQLLNSSVPAIAHVEVISADGNPIDIGDSVRIPASRKKITFSYSGLSFAAPERIRFRYFLDGFDHGWSEPVAAREAVYTNLSPGSYRFRVTASNSDGAWNGVETAIPFEVEPTYYQTNWFRSLWAALFLLLLWALYQFRVQQLARQFNIRLEERVSERTRIARELHDTLLQSFHGLLLRFQTVYDLLPTRPAEAKQHLASAIDQAAESITEGRDAVQGLRVSSVEDNDLVFAIRVIGEELAADESNHCSATFQVAMEGTPRNLHPIIRDEIYRIASEALRNAFRHAQARHIEVEIRYDETQLRLRVRDDGKGIDPKVLESEGRAGHWGLHGMRERAELVGGKLDVWSEIGSGTEVDLNIPASAAYARSSARRRSWLSEMFSR
jgi:signal transduction histidine kinase/ligand-binding sensor domain-containing protein